jgi:hypothetical protein
MIEQILKFLEQEYPRNAWLRSGPFQLYVRRGVHLLDKMRDTLDLANMEIEEAYRGLGTFTQFIDSLEEIQLPNVEVIFVENVLQPRFQAFWARRGYTLKKNTMFDNMDGPPSYWKIHDR